jgi:hypothetical protein
MSGPKAVRETCKKCINLPSNHGFYYKINCLV